MQLHQGAGKRYNRKTANRPFENKSQLGYLGITVTNKNPDSGGN
jgi:hypothetical protein